LAIIEQAVGCWIDTVIQICAAGARVVDVSQAII
jgi:hypothetical protein